MQKLNCLIKVCFSPGPEMGKSGESSSSILPWQSGKRSKLDSLPTVGMTSHQVELLNFIETSCLQVRHLLANLYLVCFLWGSYVEDMDCFGLAIRIAELMSHWPMRNTLIIQLLESPIPAPAAPAPAAAPSQKASSGDISGTKRGTIDPLVSKRPEKNSE